MFLVKIVLIAFTCTQVIRNVFVSGQSGDEEVEEPPQEEEKTIPKDKHTFVALINIVFVDGRRRECTGSIIHDYVVITAAHCFQDGQGAEAELTSSFVVIGTKKMFDTGYENYLPIERVILHPKFRGWTADIALVYTFAGMTTDKPGNIIALVGERTLTPVDSNVTLLSWGHCKLDDDRQTRLPYQAPKHFSDNEDAVQCDDGEELVDNYCEPKIGRMASSINNAEESSEEEKIYKYQTRGMQETQRPKYRYALKDASGSELSASESKHKIANDGGMVTLIIPEPTKTMSYLSSIDEKEIESARENESEMEKENAKVKQMQQTYRKPRHRYYKAQRDLKEIKGDTKLSVVERVDEDLTKRTHIQPERIIEDLDEPLAITHGDSYEDIDTRNFYLNSSRVKEEIKKTRRKNTIKQTNLNDTKIKKYYKNRRKQEENGKQNRLSIETFGFVNVQTCKKLVDKVMPNIYQINPNYVACYSSEDHFMNDEDSGAPAIRNGHLVAVTVGGVECDGDHVAIGMKMSCYCPWIAENLPDGGEDLKCCIDCCDGSEKDEQQNYNKHGRHRGRSYV